MAKVTTPPGLAEITTQLGKTYVTAKGSAKNLDAEKKKFFKACTEAIEADRTLAQQTIEIPDYGQGDIEAYVAKWHPGWRIVEGKAETAIIEEDPSLQKHVYVNQEDGQVYQRNIKEDTPQLDDELLRSKDSDLWEQITCPAKQYTWLMEFRDWVEGNAIKRLVDDFMDAVDQGDERELRPLDDLSDEELDAISEYVVPGKLSTRLEPPREAKPEELDG